MTSSEPTHAKDLTSALAPFIAFLAGLEKTWPAVRLAEYLGDAGRRPEQTAIACVDVTNAFCKTGPLASPRVARIVEPITRLFLAAHSLGVTHFLLPQDSHASDAEEFGSYPAHAVAGTFEAQTVSELAGLPFSHLFTVMPKNSIDSFADTALPRWLDEHPDVREFVVVGDCTDLCVYYLAMRLKVRSHVRRLGYRVTVPADCVDTYDLPVDAAARVGAMPHDAELLHRVFLYHMQLNGVAVVQTLAP
jgi:nicotinamidase-related amidase